MSVTFQNLGVLDLKGLTTFGLSAKPESTNPIGYFGTGLKYAIAVLLRNNCKITVWLGMEKYEITTRDSMFRDQEYNEVLFGDDVLPFTAKLGTNWDLWMAYRELYANTMDEPDALVTDENVSPHSTCTTIKVEGAAFNAVHDLRQEIFLQTAPSIILDGVEIHDYATTNSWIYYRGIRVLKLPKQALYTYNITAKVNLTEDRTLPSLSDFYRILAKAVTQCEHPSLIRMLLLANHQYFESRIDYNWWTVTPGETFNKIVARFVSTNTSFNTSARELHKRDNPKEKPPSTLQYETLHIERRRKLRAALMFWRQLGIAIPSTLIHITNDKLIKKSKVIGTHMYLAEDMLDTSMRDLTGHLYKMYSDTKPSIGNATTTDILVDTIVEFGERLLGVDKKMSA